MRFRLEEGEPPASAVRRLVVTEVDHALEALEKAPAASLDATVHEARRSLKKIRAVLKLARAGLGAPTHRAEDVFYRDLGRELRAARDASVLVAVVDRLVAPGNRRSDRGSAPLRERLARRRDALSEELAAGDTLPRVARGLREGRARVGGWPLEGDGFELLQPGLRRAYARARLDYLKVCRFGGGPAVFHEWRKRSKDVRYHLDLLEGLWPSVMGAAAAELHRLTDLLGDANDLSALLDTLAREPGLVKSLEEGDVITQKAELQRWRLWADALLLGRRVYAETPAAYVRRLRSYWEAPPGRLDVLSSRQAGFAQFLSPGSIRRAVSYSPFARSSRPR